MTESTEKDIDEFRFHFDSMYIGGIPRLLDEAGAFLAFLTILTAVDALAGVWNPNMGSGERFKGFVAAYFPDNLKSRAEDLWRFRNLMVHAFNPGPFALVCNQSRLHLTPHGEVTVLNAQDFYTALVLASQNYFRELQEEGTLRANFRRRIDEKDGGAPDSHIGARVTT
ncbi:hypothetical protein Nhal_2306 [Nitrosococcus halophilus Nc 4]|uniref:Uncharacterized protein n=1 Tax=Nitrosococcus halophilus (strain Nc4) TaxID=472759 RepID=D5BV44_NITHN|nr:hypothetical protein [Nitrosococcus halophilus]ADE15394.1 hypothetical protein Nhal_2306 [Nitrosococcus halophilus Nc 4]